MTYIYFVAYKVMGPMGVPKERAHVFTFDTPILTPEAIDRLSDKVRDYHDPAHRGYGAKETLHSITCLTLLDALDPDELVQVAAAATTLAAQKRQGATAAFVLTFEATNDPRKGVPYVAKLGWDHTENKLTREFYDFTKTRARNSITVHGTFRCEAGDIIEKRTGGSWKNDYRSWYFVSDDGDLIELTHVEDSKGKMAVQLYLAGEMSRADLLARRG